MPAAIAALTWLLVPAGGHSSSAVSSGGLGTPGGQQTSGLPSSAGGSATGATAAAPATGATGGSSGGAVNGSSPGAANAGASASGGTGSGSTATSPGDSGSSGPTCTSPPGNAPGVSAKQIRIAVTMAGSFSNFTSIAEQQGFKPKYGLPDEAIIAISYGSQHPDYNNIAGAIAITDSRYGEEHTHSLTPTAATSKCNSYFTSHGQPTLYQMGVITGANMGVMCDELWMFKAAVEHSPQLSPAALGAGLQAAKSVDFSYPLSPNDFSGCHVTYGGEYWRPTEFMSSCTCLQVVDPNFHPSYS